MNTLFSISSPRRAISLGRSVLQGIVALVLATLVAGCDSNDPTDEATGPITGVWTATVPVEWTRTYALPEGAILDSVQYQFSGTHTFRFNLQEETGTVTGTGHWKSSGTYAVVQYEDGRQSVVRDDSGFDDGPQAVLGTFSGSQLTFPAAANDWIRGPSTINLTLTRGDLLGDILHTYLVQEWVTGTTPAQVQTRFEFPVPVRLIRQER